MNITFRTLLTGIVTFAALNTPAVSAPYKLQEGSTPSSFVTVNATPAKSSEEEISKLFYRSISVINKSGLSDADKEKKLTEIFMKYCDLSSMTKLAAGRFWRQASPSQQVQLTNEFRLILIRDYMRIFGQYPKPKLTIMLSEKAVNPDDMDVLVKSYLTTSAGQQVFIDWHKTKVYGGFKIDGIVVDGKSMVESYRGEFNSEITKNGMDGLIKTLSDRNNSRK